MAAGLRLRLGDVREDVVVVDVVPTPLVPGQEVPLVFP
jgi:hypothetical protein